ncbi:MAG: hypothetical protein LBQ32_08725, partial [Burkholderiaceae bacterium]|nr:hypothetical protein [Burkholderiaceae bacterium]
MIHGHDLSSSDLDGSCRPLAKLGYRRDGNKGIRQVNYGLLTASKLPLPRLIGLGIAPFEMGKIG